MTTHLGKSRRAIGCMTGTSLDALDVALISVVGEGLELSVTVEDFVSVPLGELSAALRNVADQKRFSAGEIVKLEHEFSQFHLKPLRNFCQGRDIDLISLHGQTIYHNPPWSWQLINPSIIAHALQVKTVYNLRAADLALGGEGAPITPLADFILFRNMQIRTAIVNLGGFCNVTIIPRFGEYKVKAKSLFQWSREIRGKDLCLCNLLLDRISSKFFGQKFDDGGKRTAEGNILAKPYDELYAKLLQQSRGGKSLGSEDMVLGWLENYENGHSGNDLAQTACTAIAAVIAESGDCELMILAGGGVHNNSLVNVIVKQSSFQVTISDQFGIAPVQREAVEIAILGLLCQDRVPITLPQITGVMGSPVSGSWVLP